MPTDEVLPNQLPLDPFQPAAGQSSPVPRQPAESIGDRPAVNLDQFDTGEVAMSILEAVETGQWSAGRNLALALVAELERLLAAGA